MGEVDTAAVRASLGNPDIGWSHRATQVIGLCAALDAARAQVADLSAERDEARKVAVARTLNEAYERQRAERAEGELMLDQTYYDEDTLFKVQRGLHNAGLSNNQRRDAITEMLNEGILFRERQRDDLPAPTPAEMGWVMVALLPRAKYRLREIAAGWEVLIYDERSASSPAERSGWEDSDVADFLARDRAQRLPAAVCRRQPKLVHTSGSCDCAEAPAATAQHAYHANLFGEDGICNEVFYDAEHGPVADCGLPREHDVHQQKPAQ